ncbi:MAG TPA: TlpA disulfide reductase family protein [Gemmataceae bacterium]|nr:TlpA disulfide reductase family protein [Gemmataceae bacterium]
MRAIRCCVLAGLAALLCTAGRPAAPAQEKAAGVTVQVVKYDGLADAVRGLRGKVVLVDFWGIDCGPCKKAFPHVMQMQRKYGADGLAVVSVAIKLDDDSPLDRERGRVLKFLQDQGATTTNLLLDEKADVWQGRLRFDAIPAVYVFNRQGKWYQFKDEFSYDDVEKLVADLVKTK